MLSLIKRIIHFFLNLFYPIFKKILPKQVYAYLAVGAANTLFNIGLFTVFYLLIFNSVGLIIGGFNLNRLSVEIATIISFLLSVVFGFWLSKNFAFTDASNEKNEKNKQFGKYFLVALQGQFSDYLITKGLIVFLHIEPTIAYFISTIIMLIINFFLQKYYTFKVKNHKVA
jgi:putative flippase GtrA